MRDVSIVTVTVPLSLPKNHDMDIRIKPVNRQGDWYIENRYLFRNCQIDSNDRRFESDVFA